MAIIPTVESGPALIDEKMTLVKIWFVSRHVTADVKLETADVKGRSKGGLATTNLCGSNVFTNVFVYIFQKKRGIIMKEIKDIIEQLEIVSFDDCTKELSALKNTSVLLGNVERLNGSEDSIVVSPLNNYKQKFQFKIQDIENIEKIESNIFKVFIKGDSNCIVISNAGIKKRNRFNFKKMGFPVYSRKYGRIIVCDKIICDSCHVNCDCDSCDCHCFECVCDGECEWGGRDCFGIA